MDYDAIFYLSPSGYWRAESNVSWQGVRGNWPIFGAGETIDRALMDLERALRAHSGETPRAGHLRYVAQPDSGPPRDVFER